MADPELLPMFYKHPPITEAVIGINFSSPIKQADVNLVNNKFHSHYPNNQAMSNFNVAVELSNIQINKPTTNCKKEEGHRRSTADMTQLLVLWPSSFALSQLAPYQGWDHFFERFVRDWALWKRTIGFQTISRIGVRYINRIDIPVKGSITKYEEFLNVYPKLPESLDPIIAYAVQVASELKDIDCLLKINSAAVPSPLLGFASFVIDLDISKEVNPPQSDNDIFDLLNKIRVQKNGVFEACISNRARDLFQ
ncbi:MAG: TIGR04255 family protein [Sulfuricella sp.]